MAGYIKSHSNYRLQTRHQVVNDGIILERDISTVGGVNSFATGQSTIYQSGNFVVVVNNGGQVSRNIRKKGWLASGDNNDTWNEEILSYHSSDVNGSVEKSIMLKNDFMDLRSFAYYGSLADLIQNTVLKIISTYPYELYYNKNSNYIENVWLNHKTQADQSSVTIDNVEYDCVSIIIKPYKKFVLNTDDSVIIINESGTLLVLDQNYFETNETEEEIIVGKHANISDKTVNYHYLLRKVSNPGDIDIHNVTCGSSLENMELGYFYNGGYTNYEIFKENDNIDNAVGFNWVSLPVETGNVCPEPWKKISTISIRVDDWDKTIVLYAYWDDELNIVYLTDDDVNFHIRPKSDRSYYDDFVDDLDLFGKCLVGVYSGIKNTSKFEILRETNKGTKREVKTFTIPNGPGGYNINSNSIAMRNYISELGEVGIIYDERYTDNLFRMMTHDSLKNLDWTNGFNGNDEDGATNEYIKTGEKFSSVIRVMGYTFDQEKAYIDNIGNVNTVTYSNRNNLSDYFLTDALETDGICVNAIYPYELTEYNLSGDTVPQEYWTEYNQLHNEYIRKFSENTSDIILPYNGSADASYTKCVDGESKTIYLDDDFIDKTYYVESGYTYNIETNYHNDYEMSIPDVNNEFIKRFKINSRHILRKKGTIDGIESILSLFGMKSKRWCGNNNSNYDFNITETTYFAEPIIDVMDNVHKMYKIDWYNSCKTIPYDTLSYINGEYIPYQGLPVSYRDVDNNRKLYPYFQSSGIYDGDMYYQMNGGWIGYLPYWFDVEDRFLVSISGDTRVETMRNIMQVENITELINQSIGDLYDNAIYYVSDISEKFALINGYPYKINEESIDGNVKYYFEVNIQSGSVSIGGELYQGVISVTNSESGMTDYDLSVYENGSPLRIYYTGNRNYAFNIEQDGYGPETSLIFIDGSYGNDKNSISHYFILKDANFAGLIGRGYWEEVQNNSKLYQKIENITDNTLGNNPHSGNFSYDNGEEYLNRYRKLFKYANEYRYFNESCFADVDEAYDEINEYGFSLLQINDSKVHSFINRINADGTETPYDINDKSSITSIPEYSGATNIDGADGVTSQIINTKKIDLSFYLHFDTIYEKSAQEEIKYIQCRIMPYVEQMISSTSILNVHFVPREPITGRIFDETFDQTFN